MHQLMHLLADEIVAALKSKQPCACRVCEGADALEIDAVYALSCRVQQHTNQLVRLSQLGLNPPALRDIDERDDAADEFPVPLNRVRPVLGRERVAVRTDHDLVVHVHTFRPEERPVDLALLDGIRLAIRPRVMHERVHVLAEQVRHLLEPEQFAARRIGEGAIAIHISPVDPLAGRVQKQPDQFFVDLGISLHFSGRGGLSISGVHLACQGI